MRPRLAMRQLAICSRSGMNFAQRVVHTGFAALLIVGGGFAGEGPENETKQRQPKRRPQNVNPQSQS